MTDLFPTQKPLGAEQATGRRTWRDDALHAIWIALLVFIGYGLGAKIGIAFGFPATQTAVFWPPNIVLIAALLLTPRRRWWIIIAAGLPAEFLAASFPGAPAYVAGLNYAGNAGQAVLTAVLLQRYCGGIPKFDNFMSTAWFVIIAAFLAPAMVSFLVAAVFAVTGWTDDFWLTWRTRFLTDVLTALTLGPPVLLLLTADVARLRQIPARRYVEAALLGVCFLAISVLAVRDELAPLRGLRNLIYIPLPLLLWVGIRFGVKGVTVGLLLIVMAMLWYAVRVQPLSQRAPSDAVALQLFLINVSFPLILIAALWGERRGTVQALRDTNSQIHHLAAQLITAQEEERRRVARELHDEVGQALTAVKINLDTLRLCDDTDSRAELLGEGMVLVDHALEQVRDLSLLLRPAMLDDLGLVATLRWLSNSQAERYGYRALFTTAGLQPQPSPEAEIICYRVAQEALTNVARYAQARNVHVDLRVLDGQLQLTVRDDGIGFDSVAMRQRAVQGASMGLLSMEERATLGQGSLQIASAPGQGATLTLTLPYPSLA